MAKDTPNNIRLGLFILAGMAILIFSLFLIGKNQNFFGSNFTVRARFSNINGLMAGNNVRYSGIQVGTVDKIQVIDDTTIEVTLLIDEKMKPFIHQNAIVAIGNDGLMGNKVINITPNKTPAPEVTEGGLLYTKKALYTDEMLATLSSTNNNVELLSERLLRTVEQLNNSTAFWGMLNDTAIPRNLNLSLVNIREATVRINEVSAIVNTIARDMRDGKGAAGVLLTNEKAAEDMRQAIEHINSATKGSVVIMRQIDSIVNELQNDLSHGRGTAHAILKDTALVTRLNNSMANIEKGTAAFNEDMEALKHNFLIRGYFRKEAKKNKKASSGNK